jgi:iron complex transport system substrate-binding protein
MKHWPLAPSGTRAFWLCVVVGALLLGACGTTSTTTESGSDTAANAGECVERYDPAVDYFPDKATLRYADEWTIEYFNHYKVISVLTPWQGAEETFRYVLVQCGTPVPDGFDEAQVIEIPTQTIVTMSTTYLSHLAELGLLDRLVGLDNPQFVHTPAVVEMIEAGELATVRSGTEINVERILALDPSLVMTYGMGTPADDVHPQLIAAGVPVAINAEYVEPTPLGRAEWIKFTAAFFNEEAVAEEFFAEVATRYEDLAARASASEERPTLLVNAPFQGTWYMPGGNSFLAQFFADAGADYLWADDDTQVSLQLSFETVFAEAANADIWVHPGAATSLDELLAMDERFANFAAFQQGAVYNNTKRLNENGGNDYWESGMINPHLILADQIAIFHPDLLPDHELYYYQRLR